MAKFNNAKDLFKWLAYDELSKDEILDMLTEEMCAELIVNNNMPYLEKNGGNYDYHYDGEVVGTFNALKMSADYLETLLRNAITYIEDQGIPGAVFMPELGISDEEYDSLFNNELQLVKSLLAAEEEYDVLLNNDFESNYPHLSLCADFKYLKDNLNSESLQIIESILDAYNKNKIDLDISRDEDGKFDFSNDISLSVLDKGYVETGFELLVLKWYESYEDTGYLVECFDGYSIEDDSSLNNSSTYFKYQQAVNHFNKEMGFDIENDYIRSRAEQLVCCFENKANLIDFDLWTRYEDLLKEKLSYNEYLAISENYDDSPFDVEPEDKDKIAEYMYFLKNHRIKKASDVLCGIESPYKSYGEMGKALSGEFAGQINAYNLKPIVICDDLKMEGVYLNSDDNKFYMVFEDDIVPVVPTKIIPSDKITDNELLSDLDSFVRGETDDLRYYVWFDEAKPVKEYVLTLCEGELEEEFVRAHLTETEVDKINKVLAGELGFEFNITTVDGKVVGVGIIDKIGPVEEKSVEKLSLSEQMQAAVEKNNLISVVGRKEPDQSLEL